jgi:hypothetical protein
MARRVDETQAHGFVSANVVPDSTPACQFSQSIVKTDHRFNRFTAVSNCDVVLSDGPS